MGVPCFKSRTSSFQVTRGGAMAKSPPKEGAELISRVKHRKVFPPTAVRIAL